MSFCLVSKNFDINIRKNVIGKYNPGVLVTRQKLVVHPQKSATDTLKTASLTTIQGTAEITCD